MGKGYIDIAERDYEYFQQMIQMFQKTRDPYYNKVVVEAQQIVEKVLKGIIEQKCVDTDHTDALHQHKLSILGNVIFEELGIRIDDLHLRYLSDFYFDARYPGNSYIEATKKDAEIAIGVVDEVLAVARELFPGTFPEYMDSF